MKQAYLPKLLTRKAGVLLYSASVLAINACLPSHAMAQASDPAEPGAVAPQTAPAAQETAEGRSKAQNDVQDIIVTGTRLTQNGYRAPTPVTVATAQDLNSAAPTTLLTGLRQLPQFTGSSTNDNQQNVIPSQPNSGNVLNIRGLGGVRTLILMDGERVPATTYTGTVNADVIPQLLVQRVDVVTAGASAAYGSDAVAGVVNFVLDDDFRGLKGVVQGGVSDRGDYKSYRAGLAFGVALDERTHFLISAERYENKGFLKSDRPELSPYGFKVGKNPGAGTPGTAANPYVDATSVHFSTMGTLGGIATSGPFANYVFLAPGQYRPAIIGTVTGTPNYYTGDSDLAYFPADGYQSAPIQNTSLFARLSHDLTDNATLYVQGNVSDNRLRYDSTPSYSLNRPIFSGNPYIPDDLQEQLADSGAASFNFSKLWYENGFSNAREKNFYYNILVGAKGDLKGFAWNINYQTSSARMDSSITEFQSDRYYAALDAVEDGAGNIVCNVSLNADPSVRARYAGCVPLNPFGFGSASAEALNYVNGLARYRAVNKMNIVSASIAGDLVDLWAGPLSVALGAEYRTQDLKLTSNSDPAVPTDTTGLRAAPANVGRFTNYNVGTANGSLNVKEVFGEMSLPLLRDLPFVQLLNINAAFRRTDYSTSGAVSTWKVGGTWKPVDGVTFRLTRSRDIRAPNLYELNAGDTTSQVTFLDPHTNVQGPVTYINRGNTALKPEIGNTLTFGVVLQPAFLDGFSFSADYYDVAVTNVIQTIDYNVVARECETSGGTAPNCALIVRPLDFSDRTPANFPTAIYNAPVNAAGLWTKGIDFESSYRGRLGPGDLQVRLIASYVKSFRTQASPSQPVIEYAGYTEGGSSQIPNPVPKWKMALSGDYQVGDFRFFVQERMIGSLKRGPVFVWDEPSLPAVFYTDMTVAWKIKPLRSDSELFFNVSNLFDRKAPFITQASAGPGLALSTLAGTYDIVGRSFTFGLRLKM